MWLWLCLCFVSTVIAQNDIPESGTSKFAKNSRDNEEVLLKIWMILADILDADGTVKVPSHDNIQFALTLIKKTILENKDGPNIDLKEKLFLLEAELAKYKGVYIYDARPLQTLLDVELKPDHKPNLMFKYELRANDKPNCKKAFEDLIQRVHRDYNDLANSLICTDGPIDTQSSQYSLYNFEYANHLNTNNEPGSNNIENKENKWNFNNNIGDLIQNPNPLRIQGDVNEVIGAAHIPLNTIEPNNLLHAVQLSKDTHRLIGNNYNADLEHAKTVADNINALYQSSNTQAPPVDPGLYPKPPLRELHTSLGAINIETQNTPWSTSHSMPVIQNGYITQSELNPLNTVWNKSYSIGTNTLQSQPPVKTIVVNQDYTNPLNTFVNSKYHPNPAHDNDSVVKELPSNGPVVNAESIPQTNTYNAPSNKKLYYNSQPNQDKVKATETPQHENIAIYPYKTPTRTYAEQSPNTRNNYLNYKIYPFIQPNYQNFLQNSYAYKPGYNPYGLKLNYYNNPYQYYSQLSTMPGNTRAYKNYMLQQSVVQPQGKLFTMNYVQQNNPSAIFGQKIVQSIPAQVQTYKVINPKPIQNYAYGMTQIQTNVPQFTHTSFYNGQPVIDKLADWVTGTNSAKLNSDNDLAEIELTYLVKKPPPLYNPNMFYIKFRMPYKAFAKHLSELLKPETLRSASPNTDLYTNLASQYNATVIPSGISEIPEDMKSVEDKVLVRATYIKPNEPGKTNPNSVDIINLVKEPEPNANMGNQVNTVSNSAPTPVLRN